MWVGEVGLCWGGGENGEAKGGWLSELRQVHKVSLTERE